MRFSRICYVIIIVLMQTISLEDPSMMTKDAEKTGHRYSISVWTIWSQKITFSA